MTLIEVLFLYRDAVRQHGREQARLTLMCVGDDLREHIINSVSDEGAFVCADGGLFLLDSETDYG